MVMRSPPFSRRPGRRPRHRTAARRAGLGASQLATLASVAEQCHVARDDHHRHAAPGDGDADRLLEDARHLVGVGDQLDIVRALGEELLGMRLLEVGAADLGARDVGGDRQHRHAAALAVEQAVDQVQVAGAAASGADGELAGEVRLGAGGEGGRLLVPHVDPVDLLLPAQRIGEAVQRIAHHAVDALHAGDAQGFGHQVGDRARHARLRLLGVDGAGLCHAPALRRS